MTKFNVVAAIMAALVAAAECSAALFTSTASTPRASYYSVGVFTELRRPDNNVLVGGNTLYGAVLGGYNSVSVTVDTTADTLRYDDISLMEPGLPPSTEMSTTPINYQVLVAPPDFPNPPVYQTVNGDYTTRITFISAASSAPTFLSASTAPINYSFVSGTFVAGAQPTMIWPDITLNGIYEAIGPDTTVNIPFSVVYKRHPSTPARSSIPAGGSLDNGFAFTPFQFVQLYEPQTNTIVDQVVDNVRYRAQMGTILIDYFAIPEPSSVGLLGLGVVALGAHRRRR